MENSDSPLPDKTVTTSFSGQGPIPLEGNKNIPLGSGEVTRLLGTGGMAAVYEIWNPRLEMHRAVKIINPGSSETAHKRFETEIKISAKLKHPNIVEIHGTGEWNTLPFIEMEKVEGLGLDRIIKERGALPQPVCTAIGIMICRALEYAHQCECVIYGVKYQGVIHRDLKPSNIMISSNGTVKLMDFGIARPMDATFQTLDGLVSGTLQYLAPEQIEKKELDARTDIYALGICLYEMVTGAIAFPQTSFAELVTFKVKSRFKPIDEFPVKASAQFKRAISKCLQQEPDKRFLCAADLCAELEKIHLTSTDQTPEKILARFAAERDTKSSQAAGRARTPVKLLASLLVICGIAALCLRYGLPAFRHQIVPAPAIDSGTVSKPAIDPAKALLVPDTAAIEPPAAQKPRPDPQKSLRENSSRPGARNGFAEKMQKQLDNGNFAAVLAACKGLPSAGAVIFELRALQGLGDETAIASFLKTVPLDDGELCLAKAKLSYNKGKYRECEKLAEQCQAMPCALMSAAALKREASYYTALCASAGFDAHPNNQTYTTATKAWLRVQALTKTNLHGPYAKKAATELARMEKMMGR